MTVRRRQIEFSAWGFGDTSVRPNSCGMTIRAGNRGRKRVVPPAGEKYAFTVDQWARRVEIYVSPTGRSVRVWVNGTEVKTP